VADVLAEALGGWIFQWEIARLRHKMELLTEHLLTTLREARRRLRRSAQVVRPAD
jgi:hypothetical protein